MKKTYNFYCDESTHIENDGKPYMLLSYVSTPYTQLKLHNKRIRDLKKQHYFKGELKWGALSKSQYPFYNELIEYFFATDLQFRAIVIDKEQLRHSDFNQTHDDFYDKSLDATQVMAAIQLYDRGVIAKQDLQENARNTGMIDPSRTNEDINADSEDTSPIDE